MSKQKKKNKSSAATAGGATKTPTKSMAAAVTLQEAPFHYCWFCEIKGCENFLMMGNRHHCRLCGISVCSEHMLENITMPSKVFSDQYVNYKCCCVRCYRGDDLKKWLDGKSNGKKNNKGRKQSRGKSKGNSSRGMASEKEAKETSPLQIGSQLDPDDVNFNQQSVVGTGSDVTESTGESPMRQSLLSSFGGRKPSVEQLLESELTKQTHAMQSLGDELILLQSVRANDEEELNALQNALQKATSKQLDISDHKDDQSTSESISLQNQILKLSTEISEKESEHNTVRKLLESKEQQLKEMRDSYNDLKAQLEQLHEDKSNQIHDLQQKISDLERGLRDAHRQVVAADRVRDYQENVMLRGVSRSSSVSTAGLRTPTTATVAAARGNNQMKLSGSPRPIYEPSSSNELEVNCSDVDDVSSHQDDFESNRQRTPPSVVQREVEKAKSKLYTERPRSANVDFEDVYMDEYGTNHQRLRRSSENETGDGTVPLDGAHCSIYSSSDAYDADAPQRGVSLAEAATDGDQVRASFARLASTGRRKSAFKRSSGVESLFHSENDSSVATPATPHVEYDGVYTKRSPVRFNEEALTYDAVADGDIFEAAVSTHAEYAKQLAVEANAERSNLIHSNDNNNEPVNANEEQRPVGSIADMYHAINSPSPKKMPKKNIALHENKEGNQMSTRV